MRNLYTEPTLQLCRLAPLLIAFSFLAAGCSEDEPELSPSEDLRGLVRFLQEVHPRPYESLDDILEDELDRLDELAEPDELATAFSFHRLLSWMDDQHLAVALPMFQPSAPPLSLVPVAFKAIDSSFYIDASSAALPHGTELLAIDGVQMESIWIGLLALTFTDGANLSARMEIIERDFPRYYPLIYGLRPSYVLSVRFPDGQNAEVPVDGITAAAYAELPRHSAPLRGERTAPRGQPQWPKLIRLDASSVLLRLPDFGIADQAEYARRVDEIFAGLSGNDALILDVRGNPGGLRTNGIAVLNHLLSAPYAQWQAMSARVLRIPDEHRDRVDFPFPFAPEAALAQLFGNAPKIDGRYVFTGDPLAEKMKPHGPGYPGRVSVFVDSATASAAVEMLVALSAFRPDTAFIGHPSATDCRRHIGELPATYTAPSSGLVILVSLIELTHVAAAGCLGDGSFFTQAAPSYTVDDFLGGVDPYLTAYALSGLAPAR